MFYQWFLNFFNDSVSCTFTVSKSPNIFKSSRPKGNSPYSLITELDLSWCKRFQDISELFMSFPNIERLDLSGCDELTDLWVLTFTTNLRELKLSRCRNLMDIRALEFLPNLRSLDISYCTRLMDISVLKNCAKLVYLNI